MYLDQSSETSSGFPSKSLCDIKQERVILFAAKFILSYVLKYKTRLE